MQPSSSKNVEFQKVKAYFVQTLTTELDAQQIPAYKRRSEAIVLLEDIYNKTNLPMGETLRQQIFRDVIDHLFGFGPIQPLLDDESITEVMVNGCNDVYVERAGKLIKTKVTFENDEHIIKVIERIIFPLGRRIDYDNPSVDARLPDGSRVNAIIPPVAIDGPSITIRKFTRDKLKPEQLIEFGSITEKMVEFLRVCVVAKLNIVISGGTGSGKTTLLNVLSGFIPEKERIVTIEDAAELQLQQDHIVRLETKPANSEGVGEVSVRDLVRNSLRMRPDRIVVGEVRGGEAIDMLQAMNTGHDGSLTTLHANTPRDALSRLETMAMMSGLDIPINIIREQISSAVDVIVQQSRLDDGSRKVTQISEVAGMEGNTIVMTDVFKFEQSGVDESGNIIGELRPTGIRPLFSARLEKAGLKLGPEVFGVVMSRDESRRRSSRRRR
ncbi:MAG: CpaF family protein [Chloroflexi bacterium]|nr:CpaF family protein [Chloroflexota bacterium]